MPVIVNAKKKDGGNANIAIGDNGIITIIEDGKTYISSDDYSILKNYSEFGCIDDEIKRLSWHIRGLNGYICFVNKRLQIEQHLNESDFNYYKDKIIGSKWKDYGEDCIAKIKEYIESQNRKLEESCTHAKLIFTIKWVGGLLIGAILALCACIVFCEYKDETSRYQKSGSTLIDTETNSVLIRRGKEWKWEPIKNSVE